jgi:hypothetical protein
MSCFLLLVAQCVVLAVFSPKDKRPTLQQMIQVLRVPQEELMLFNCLEKRTISTLLDSIEIYWCK